MEYTIVGLTRKRFLASQGKSKCALNKAASAASK